MSKNSRRQKAPSPNRTPNQHNSRRQGQNRLVQLAISGAILGLVVTLASFAILGLWQLPASNQALLQGAATRIADQQAAFIDTSLQRMLARLVRASGEPGLIGALEQRDADAIAARQASLEHHYPEAVSTRVLPLGPLGIAGLRRDDAGLRNNIEMDLLRRAAEGQTAGPEAYRIDGRWLVSIAQPVASSDGGHSAGAILLTLPADYFNNGAANTHGQTSLLQTLTRQPQAFSQAGSGELEEAAEERRLSVEHWRLRFTPSLQLAAEQQLDGALLWALAAVSIAAILGGALLTAQLFRRILLRNVAAFANDDHGALDLPGFAALRNQIDKRLSAAPVSVPDAAEAVDNGSAPAPRPVAEPAPAAIPVPVVDEETAAFELPAAIFRAYDIRGIADTQLSEAVVYHLGLAIGSQAQEQGQQTVVVARDGRESSPRIAETLVNGLRDSGRDVIDLGIAPTPLLYFATHKLDTQAGVMVTGSHNSAEYNGMKIVLGGRPVAGEAIQALRERIDAGQFTRGQGSYTHNDQIDAYIDAIAADVAIAQPLKVVLDAGNGVAGRVAPQLFQALGCEVVPLYCDVDGRFPNHHPDPTVAANLTDLVAAVREHDADLGLAFDGDGDRLGAVTASGQIVTADQLLMLMARDVVSRNPGADVVFDVKCSRHLNAVISQFGGRPIMWKSGHSFMKEKMLETGALLGGEFSGHIYFKERWFGFDDALYAGARLIEILSTGDPSLDNQLATLPASVGTPELRLKVAPGAQFELARQLLERGQWGNGKITTLDGIRVDYADGWGLVRASNTEPALMLRFEADDAAGLERIQQLFRDQLADIDPDVAARF